MEKRILELAAESSCRADYLSEVLRAPVTAVQTELDRLTAAGKLVKKTITLYQIDESGQPKPSSKHIITHEALSLLHLTQSRQRSN